MNVMACSIETFPQGEEAPSLVASVEQQTGPLMRKIAYISGGILLLLLAIATLVPVSSGVMAPAQVTVDNRRKLVQHLEGGTIAKLHVKDGAFVKKGDVLVELDDEGTRLTVEMLQNQLDTLRADQAAREAELLRHDSVIYPADLMARSHESDVATILAMQTIQPPWASRAIYRERSTA
jgi:multidrug efflux pump subunit AcrA (membrane-fusion protein)